MTIKDYLKEKFASIGLSLKQSDLWDLDVNADEELTKDNKTEVYKAFVEFIPSLLLRPKEMSEGGASITRVAKSDIVAFYSNECERLDLKNTLVPKKVEKEKKPKVKFY